MAEEASIGAVGVGVGHGGGKGFLLALETLMSNVATLEALNRISAVSDEVIRGKTAIAKLPRQSRVYIVGGALHGMLQTCGGQL